MIMMKMESLRSKEDHQEEEEVIGKTLMTQRIWKTTLRILSMREADQSHRITRSYTRINLKND